jgi:hypothetical protein
MDEEDGKAGARARHPGHLNAHAGVPAQSLRHQSISDLQPSFQSKTAPFQSQISEDRASFSGADLPKASAPPQVEESTV